MQTKLLLMVCLIFIPPIMLESFFISMSITRNFFEQAGNRVTTVAEIAASSPVVIAATETPSGANFSAMDAFLSSLHSISQTSFIVIIDMQGTRLYHPNPDRIGRHVVGGDEGRVLAGETYLSSAKGTLGFSQRAFKPIFSASGAQCGAVIVGILSRSISSEATRIIRPIRYALVFSFATGLILSVLFSRRIKKTLFGLEPEAIAHRLEERDAMLENAQEGIIAVDAEGRLTVINREAARILRMAGTQDELLDHDVRESIHSTRLDIVLKTGEKETDREQVINGVSILTNRAPIMLNGRIIGAIATFKDMTELRSLAERLTGVNKYVDALRSSAHEQQNKLHVMAGLLHAGRHDELARYLDDVIGLQKKELDSVVSIVGDPIVAAFLQSKYSRARELGVEITFTGSGMLPQLPRRYSAGLVSVLGNLLDNAFDALAAAEQKQVVVTMESAAHEAVFTVEDTGCGIESEALSAVFAKGWSSKSPGRGMGLHITLMVLEELNGTIEVASVPGRGSSFTVRIPLPDGEGTHDYGTDSGR